MDTSRSDDLARDAERLERYAVEGERALRDPGVAASVAARPGLVREIDAGLARLRAPLAADPEMSVVPRRPSAPASVPASAPTRPSSRIPHPIRRWVGMPRAALAATVLSLGIVAVVVTRASKTATSVDGPAREYVTHAGQRATVTLPDGTSIQLAPNTRLRVPKAFGGATRTVALDGEALFDVRHQPGEPFAVRTGGITTRVLGTTFDVRHYPGDARVQVAVLSGKVVSRGQRTFVALMAGTVGYITDSVATSAVVRDVDTYVGWATGRLVFRETPVPELLRVLGHWYGVEFRLADSTLLASHMTLTLDQKSQTEAVAALESVLNVTTSFDTSAAGRPRITLHPRRQSSAPPRRDRHESLSTLTEVGR